MVFLVAVRPTDGVFGISASKGYRWHAWGLLCSSMHITTHNHSEHHGQGQEGNLDLDDLALYKDHKHWVL